MTLQTYIDSLSCARQFGIALKLTKLCLPIWNNYAENNELSYRDSVGGMGHIVDKEVLKTAIDAVETYLKMNALQRLLDGKRSLLNLIARFDDQIVALQDGDWQLPDYVEKAFYAVYGLLDSTARNSKTVFGYSTIYLCINQAADALTGSKSLTEKQIKEIIYSHYGR